MSEYDKLFEKFIRDEIVNSPEPVKYDSRPIGYSKQEWKIAQRVSRELAKEPIP